MLFGIAGFELRYQLRNPVFWVAVAIFFLLGFGLTASENVGIGGGSAIHENAPFGIALALAIFSIFYQFVTTSFVANAIIRDDATGFGPIVRATSVTKIDFVLGRFLGGLGIALLGYLAVPLGMAVGVMMPWVDPETVGPNGPYPYLWHFLIIAVPNIIFSSAFLLTLATTFRSMMATYIGVIIFLMGYTITSVILSNAPEQLPVVAKFELLGIAALQETSRYWTTAELNTLMVPLTGNMLFNRLFVLGLSALFVGFTIWRFSMADRPASKRKLKKMVRSQAAEAKAAATAPVLTGGDVRPAYGAATTRAQVVVRLRTEIMQVLKSPGLIVILLLAVLNSSAELWTTRTLYGTSSYQLTSGVIETLRNGFTLFLLMIAIFYGGELVWRERDRKLNEILDSTPTADWIMFAPKVVAIFVVLLLVNMAGLVTGVATQLAQGTTDFSIGQYLGWFVLPLSIDMLLIAILSVFMQVVSPNKYMGWGLMLIWFVSGIFLRNMGYENDLYRFGTGPAEPLSDMNGAGGFWIGATWLRFYWLCFGVLLMTFAHLIWPRGTVTALRPRLANIRYRIGFAPVATGGLALAGMVSSGMYINQNIKVLNQYRTSDWMEKELADFEKQYLKYETLEQPVVTNVVIDANIHPQQKRLDVIGSYMLRNDSGKPLSVVHVHSGGLDVRFRDIMISGAKRASYDKRFDYAIYRFDTPLAPGATAKLSFKSQLWYRGFRNGMPGTNVALNGTFVNNSDFAPIIGMERQGLLTDRVKRRRQGLPAELRTPKLEDMSATAYNQLHTNWVMTDITVTTDADQVPIAPGEKVLETSENGRRTVHFVSSAPIHNFYSIQSARYRLTTRQHNGIELTVYHHPSHVWNVPKMLDAMAAGLDYYQANFGPYQFKHARIIEFPGYSSFAQAFAGTMPYSESIGFAANAEDPDAIDYVTYVTAHELGHQYWAHQVVGADMQGSTMSTETLAQYSALMVMKKLYGPDKIRRFLKYELDDYLSGRKGDALEEVPLYRVENQPYIHYRKGALVMYLLQERLGEAAVNRALARLIQRYKFKGAPYHRSVDLIAEFRKEATTPEQQALITDLFERITIYDLKAREAKVSKTDDGLWTTELIVEARKYYANGQGKETEVALNEPIEVAALVGSTPGIPVHFYKQRGKNIVGLPFDRTLIASGRQKIIIKSFTKPKRAGIDPYNFYIDRNSDDNLVDVTG
jgi:ABC-2 type transport system permease protein